MRTNNPVLAGAVVVLVLAGALAYQSGLFRSVVGSARDQVTPPTPPPVAHTDSNVVPLTGRTRDLVLPYYVIKETSADPVLVERQTTLRVAGSASIWRQAHAALTAMAAFPASSGRLMNPLPSGTRIRGVHIDNNGVATVDFSPDFQSNFNGGAREEQVTIYAIVNTVGAVRGVRSVRIAIGGKTIDEFAGHVDLSAPLTPDPSLVEPAE